MLKRSVPDNAEFRFIDVLDKNFAEGTVFTCVIVGANDGVSHDLLYSFLIKRKTIGLAIEPLHEAFERLKDNLSVLPGMIAINKAVHPTARQMRLYYVDPAKLNQLPAWASGIASFDPQHHTRSSIPKEFIISTEVTAENLMNLVAENGINKEIDLLQIDTEGFDYEVLKQVDFDRLRPKVIRYEKDILSNEDITASVQLLKRKGYYCFDEGPDIIAIHPSKILL